MQKRSSSFIAHLSVVFLIISTCSLCGCQPGADGPERYEIWGHVTFQRQPVPYGEISYTPNSDQGNSGPGSVAKIENGIYKIPAEMGIVGGDYIVTITGLSAPPFDGGVPPEGTPEPAVLFKMHTIKMTLPNSKCQLDHEIPATSK